jgi:hypothetical protein
MAGINDKTTTLSRSIAFAGFALAAGCSNAGDVSQGIDVATINSLGVTALQITRVVDADNGNNVFTLRGLSSENQELAAVQLTIGVIPELEQLVAPLSDAEDQADFGSFGSKIVLSAGGDSSKSFSHETHAFILRPASNPMIAQFLGITEVSSALEQEAHVVVEPQQRASSSEVADTTTYTTQNCPASSLNSSPEAVQCCNELVNGGAAYNDMYFFGPANSLVFRAYYTTGQVCITSTGSHACGGSDCNYGPFGWAPISVTPSGDYGGTPGEMAQQCVPDNDGGCIANAWECDPGAQAGVFDSGVTFTNVGPNAPGEHTAGAYGCCGNGGGPCWQGSGTNPTKWPACSTCQGSGTKQYPKSAAVGYWDD